MENEAKQHERLNSIILYMIVIVMVIGAFTFITNNVNNKVNKQKIELISTLDNFQQYSDSILNK